MNKFTWQQAATVLVVIVASGGLMTYTDLFGVLFNLKGVTYNYTGDITCGSECNSYINVTTSYWRVCFADYNNTKYENETLFKKVARSRTLHVNLNKIDNIITTQKLLDNGSWVPYDIQVDWNVPTYGNKYRPIKDGDCWERKKVNKIQLVGHKKPEDTIKWSFMLDDYVDIDPIWKAGLTFVTEEVFAGYIEAINESSETHEITNVSQYITTNYWKYESDKYSLKVPNSAHCVARENNTVHCSLAVDIEYKSDTPAKVQDLNPGLAFKKRPFTKKVVTLDKHLSKLNDKIPDIVNNKGTTKEITLKKMKSLTKGNHTITYEFDYPMWATDKFNITILDIEIDPIVSGCMVLDQAGTYTMNQSITGSSTSYCINISANDVTLDCAGFTIDGDDVADYGIYVKRASAETTNVTIKNCVVSDWDTNGIYLYYADGNNLTNNTVNSNPDNGIYTYYSDSNTVTNLTANSNTFGISCSYSDSNTVTNITANSNNYGFYIYYSDSNIFANITANSNNYGIYSYISDSNTFTNITIKDNVLADFYYVTTRTALDCNSEFVNVIGTEEKPILFYNSSVNIQDWTNNVSEIILCGADNSNVSNLVMDRTGTENNGFFLIATQGANISNSQFTDMEWGIYSYYSVSNTVTNITANSNTDDGIYSYNSNSNTFTNITANSNTYGFYSYNSDSNTFTNISANSNNYGFYGTYSDSNTFTNVIANSNNYNGIYSYYSNSNTFTNIIANSNTDDGIYINGNLNTIKESTIYSQSGTSDVGLFISDDDNLIYNNTIHSNYYGIQLDTTATNNTIYDNRIYSNTYGLYMNGAGNGEVNLIYNNLFNQTDNVKFGTVYANNWNTTKQTGTRIYSIGTQIGGNYWTNSTGNDYSDTCTDSNTDGFCDDYYNLTNGNIDWLPLSDEYVPNLPPNCTFISQSPADINTSSTGSITILYNCSDTDGLNDSSILIATTVNHTTENNLNFSWRFPSNTKAGGAYNEQRAEHRNESKWFESLFDNIWEWSVHDCSCGHLTCSSNGSGWKVYNFTKPDVRGLFHQFFPLDKTTLESMGIDTLSYYNNNPAITEIHYRDIESNSTMQVLFYIDGTNSNKDSLIYYCNETKKTDGLSISDSTNCVYLGNIETTDSYSYTRSNVSYYELNFYIDENETIGTVKATEISYFGFVTTANAVKNWDLKYSDDTTLIGNISMNTSGMLYTSSDDGATFTQHSGTGVVWLSEIHNNIDEITYKIYACDNLSNCGWSSVTTDEIGVIQYAPGKPQIIHINGDKNKNGTYSSTIDIGCLLGKDANGDVVTGNLTLRNTDGTFNYTINGSFSDGGLEINVSFDTSLVDDGIYKLNLTNCDTTSRCSSNLLNENFTIDNGIPDLDCSLGSGISQIVYRPLIDLDNPPTNSNWLWVNASGQTNSIPLINCTNNGSATGQVQMNTSLAYQNIVDSCADNNAYTSHINLTQTFQNIGSTVAPGGSFQVWCKRGYNSSVFTMGGFDYGLTINSI